MKIIKYSFLILVRKFYTGLIFLGLLSVFLALIIGFSISRLALYDDYLNILNNTSIKYTLDDGYFFNFSFTKINKLFARQFPYEWELPDRDAKEFFCNWIDASNDPSNDFFNPDLNPKFASEIKIIKPMLGNVFYNLSNFIYYLPDLKSDLIKNGIELNSAYSFNFEDIPKNIFYTCLIDQNNFWLNDNDYNFGIKNSAGYTTVIQEGHHPQSSSEVVINGSFAASHNLGINDKLQIFNTTYNIVGIGNNFFSTYAQGSIGFNSIKNDNYCFLNLTVEGLKNLYTKYFSEIVAYNFLIFGLTNNTVEQNEWLISYFKTNILDSHNPIGVDNINQQNYFINNTSIGMALYTEYHINNRLFWLIIILLTIILLIIIAIYIKEEADNLYDDLLYFKKMGYYRTTLVGYLFLPNLIITFCATIISYFLQLVISAQVISTSDDNFGYYINTIQLGGLTIINSLIYFLVSAVILLLIAVIVVLNVRTEYHNQIRMSISTRLFVKSKSFFQLVFFKLNAISLSFGLQQFKKIIVIFLVYCFVSTLFLFGVQIIHSIDEYESGYLTYFNDQIKSYAWYELPINNFSDNGDISDVMTTQQLQVKLRDGDITPIIIHSWADVLNFYQLNNLRNYYLSGVELDTYVKNNYSVICSTASKKNYNILNSICSIYDQKTNLGIINLPDIFFSHFIYDPQTVTADFMLGLEDTKLVGVDSELNSKIYNLRHSNPQAFQDKVLNYNSNTYYISVPPLVMNRYKLSVGQKIESVIAGRTIIFTVADEIINGNITGDILINKQLLEWIIWNYVYDQSVPLSKIHNNPNLFFSTNLLNLPTNAITLIDDNSNTGIWYSPNSNYKLGINYKDVKLFPIAKMIFNQRIAPLKTDIKIMIIFSQLIVLLIILIFVLQILLKNKNIILLMKTIGYNPFYIFKYILGAYLIGIFLGFILSCFISYFVFNIFSDIMYLGLRYYLPFPFIWWLLLADFGLLCAITMLIMGITYFYVKRMNLTNSIFYC